MRFFKGCDDGVHRFEARYDKGPCEAEFKGSMSELRLQMIEKYRQITYIRDVCLRCGATIERNSTVVSLARSA